MPRDDRDRLICPILSNGKPCNAKITGLTGLQELQNLGKHLLRKHRTKYALDSLLEIRARWEK